MDKISTQALVVADPDLSMAHLGAEEIVILHIGTGRYYTLRFVGAKVWELIQVPRRVSDIVDAITSIYDVDAARCETDILALLDDMAREHLIAIQHEGLA